MSQSDTPPPAAIDNFGNFYKLQSRFKTKLLPASGSESAPNLDRRLSQVHSPKACYYCLKPPPPPRPSLSITSTCAHTSLTFALSLPNPAHLHSSLPTPIPALISVEWGVGGQGGRNDEGCPETYYTRHIFHCKNLLLDNIPSCAPLALLGPYEQLLLQLKD